MQTLNIDASLAKPAAYRELHSQLTALLDGEHDGLANGANTVAALYQSLPGLNSVSRVPMTPNLIQVDPVPSEQPVSATESPYRHPVFS